MSEDTPEPLRVVAGDATHEELAALVTALAAAASTRASGEAAPSPSRWADRGAMLGLPPVAGPGAWTASAWRR